MIDSLFKRVIAYLVDIFLVSIVVSCLVNSSVVNFQLEKYKELYDEYVEYDSLYSEQTNNKLEKCDDLKLAVEEEKLTEEKYVSSYKEIIDLFTKEEITEDEYNSRCSTIIDDYNSNKISQEEYLDKIDNYSYKISKNSIIVYIINIVINILYFVFFQGFTGGQTLGKKIMRIKVVSSKDDEKVSYKQLFIRTLFLHEISYYFLILCAILILPESIFIVTSNILYMINYVITLALVFTIAFNRGKKGIHDVVAHTRIMVMDFKGNEIKDKKEDNIIKDFKNNKAKDVKENKEVKEAEVEEIKDNKTKSKKSKKN